LPLVIFLNHNSNRGGCWGFKLKDLNRLVDLRSASDPQKTILHFIVEYIETSVPSDCDFYVDLQPLDEVSDLQQISVIKEELLELKNGIKMLEEFIVVPGSNYGSFKDTMSKFVPTSKKLVEKIDELLEKGEALFKEIITFFGESSTTTLQDFFGDLFRFGSQFQKIRLDIHHKRELEERQRVRQEQIEQQKKQQAKVPMTRLERALADLSSGSAYYKTPKFQPNNQSEATKTPAATAAPNETQKPTNVKSNNNTRTGPQKEQLAAALAFLKK